MGSFDTGFTTEHLTSGGAHGQRPVIDMSSRRQRSLVSRESARADSWVFKMGRWATHGVESVTAEAEGRLVTLPSGL